MVRSVGTNGQDILDLVHESVVVRDRELRITYWNAAATQIYGWSRAEAIGREANELLQSVHPVPLAEREAELFATGRWQGELARRTKSGGKVLVEVTWTVRHGEDGEPVEIIETGRDITEKKRVEEASRLSEYRFRSVFEAMSVAFLEIDFTAVGAMLKESRDQGVTDLRTYMMEHRDFVRHAMACSIVRQVNAKGVELFGARSPDELVGLGADRFWPEESEPVYIESLVATMEKRPQYSTETRVLTLQGDPIDVLFTVAWSEETRQRGIVLIGMIDISDRVRAFQELERSERRYRNLFNYMPIALWQFDATQMRDLFDGLARRGVTDFRGWLAGHPEYLERARGAVQVTEANEETAKLFGAPDVETIKRLLPELWIDPGDYADAAAARLTGAPHYSNETAIRTADGREIDIQFSIAFSDPANPSSSNLIGAVDISEVKRAAAALARSELKYRNLFQHMPISIWQIDTRALGPVLAQLRADGVSDLGDYIDAHPGFLDEVMQLMRVEQVNEWTVRLFGGRSAEDYVGPIAPYWQDSPGTLKRSLAARFAGADSYGEETRVRAIDGRSVDVLFTSAFPAALSEMGIGLVGAVDIGDRLAAERMLRQVQADFAHAARVTTLGELTASIAHEVNQPLAAITANGEASLRWLDRAEPNVEEARQLAARMVADARRAADIIAQIRAMATRQSVGRERLSINDLVADTLDFLQRDLQANQVRVDLATSPNLPPVEADRTQLQQVLVNLAVNAEQAMVQHGSADRRLAIRTGLDRNGAILVEVEDSGPGIPADHIACLFDSFFTTKADGLGIGLAICRSIIESHGGRIEAQNTGRGARFAFTLPAVREATCPIAPPTYA